MDGCRTVGSRRSMRDYRAAASHTCAVVKLTAVLLTFTLGLPGSLRAQAAADSPTAAGAAIKVQLHSVTNSGVQRINMPAGRGTLIDVDEPLKRASVANPEVAEVSVLSPKQVLVTGKTPGNTELLLWDDGERQAAFTVTVEMDVAEIRDAIAKVAPGAQLDIRPIRDNLLLTGTVPDTDTMNRVMEVAKILTPNVTNQVRVAGEQQVLLRCTVAEVDKTSTRQLGINGWLAGDNLHDIFVVNQIDQINPANIGASPFGPIGGPNAPRIPFATGTEGIPLLPSTTMSLGFPRIQMQIFLQAMRDNGLMRVLAEPNLVALNGQEANFIAGGEMPYPQASSTGTPSIEFKEFGIRLRFIPSILGRQMVRLTVAPEVSELDYNVSVLGVPALRKRAATTTIELTSGSTIALAGLLSDNMRGMARKVPALGDVPVLGALFSSVEYQRATTELVILVTPELVSSIGPDQVSSVPGQFMTPPNDFELFGLGLLEGKPDCDELPPEAALETMVDPRLRKHSSPPEQMSLHGPWGHAESGETQTQ